MPGLHIGHQQKDSANDASTVAAKKPSFFKRHFHHGNGKLDPSSASSSPSHDQRLSIRSIDQQQDRQQGQTTNTLASSRPHTATRSPPLSPAITDSPRALTPTTQNGTIRHTSVSPQQYPGRPSYSRNHTSENELSRVMSDDTQHSGFTQATAVTSASGMEDRPSRQNSAKRGGIQWANTYEYQPQRRRSRRASSAARKAHNRRSSIYSRASEGFYLQGVDAGVGSKARRLSIDLPNEVLLVDEVSFDKHFNMLSKANKKAIGEGGAAKVYLLKSKTINAETHGKMETVAVKQFRDWDRLEETEEEYIRKIKSEFAIAKSCDHENIVSTYQLCKTSNQYFHAMEWCSLGDINDLVTKRYFRPLDRNCMFKQLVRGVDYLHSRGIAHRDIKSENLLLTEDGCLKIADFGTAEVFSGIHPGARNCEEKAVIDDDAPIRLCSPGMVGSRPYMAPEIMQRQGDYDPRAVDVWACAIVYVTLCFTGTPWEAASPDVNNYNIYCSTWEEWLQKYPDGSLCKEDRPLTRFCYGKGLFARLDDGGTKKLILGMLHPDPKQRWSIRQALNWKTVKEYECCQQKSYSGDLLNREKKALHNHRPPKEKKGPKFLQPSFEPRK